MDPLGTSCLQIFAAGSLRTPFEELAAAWRLHTGSAVKLTYANARDLAGGIEDGEPADVFASASPAHPAALHARHLIDEPRPFATNRLVVAVPARSEARDARVLAEPGCRVVIEVAGIPLGDYTRTLLERLDEAFGDGFAQAVLRNVVSQEQTVAAVIDRLNDGHGDAAVLYSTDIPPTSGRLRAIEAPVRVAGTYVIATVRAARQPDAAKDWIAFCLGPAGQDLLRAAGFTAAPPDLAGTSAA